MAKVISDRITYSRTFLMSLKDNAPALSDDLKKKIDSMHSAIVPNYLSENYLPEDQSTKLSGQDEITETGS